MRATRHTYLRLSFLFLGICLLSVALAAQNSSTITPTVPDNGLTPADPIGIPPQASTSGDSEKVNNVNGGLSLFIPVVTLPQRGGWNLTIGYYNVSPSWHMEQDVSVNVVNNGGGAPAFDYYTYNNFLHRVSKGLQINIPTLQASIEYTGDVTFRDVGGRLWQFPTVCLTNWIFTDWSGNKHQFTNVTSCDNEDGGFYLVNGTAARLQHVTDSTDGSWLRLDTTNFTSYITIRTKDGTTYQFPGMLDPYPNPCSGPSNCNSLVNNTEIAYLNYFSSMVDTNGNKVTNVFSGNPNYTNTITDTLGRTISASQYGVTYNDANGVSRTVSLTGTSFAAQTYNFGKFNCFPGEGNINNNVKVYTGTNTIPNLAPYAETLTFPVADSTGTSRTFQLQFDGIDRLTQISYPAGGYTKYDYSSQGWDNETPAVVCSEPVQEVAHKRECSSASGCSSSQEAVTTYSPGPAGQEPYNATMDVTDPSNVRTHYVLYNFAGTLQPTSVHETDRYVYDASNTLVRNVHTDYSPWVQYADIQVPIKITTTLDDISPVLSSVQNLQYDTVVMSIFNQGRPYTPTVAIDNPTQTDDYDYASSGTGTHLRVTAQTWMNSSNGNVYAISGGHVLDRLASRTVTDPATGIQETLNYGYNTVGDITSKTIGGTGVSSLTTNYLRDSYGNITQMTDPLNNVTKFGYTDSWKDSTCAPASNSSAYLTSVTDALQHVSQFQYYSCTGLKAVFQDPNDITAGRTGTVTSFDALGRPTSVSYADGGSTTYSYNDNPTSGTPAGTSATATTLIWTGLNLVNTTVLDGFGRVSETQLNSDPEGTDYVDTTYDAAGRKATVSNPYRTTSDRTYGITQYAYDALDRVATVTQPDGSTVGTTYSGKTTIVTDEAGKQRQSQADALGRLTAVWEDPIGLNFQTNYFYDAFSNLTCIEQLGGVTGTGCSSPPSNDATSAWRVRRFSYDALSRLTSATNRESGTISYTYDADSNVLTKRALSPNQPSTGTATVTTKYTYDALNRLTQKLYTDTYGSNPQTPTVTYGYDGVAPTGCTPPIVSSPTNSGIPTTPTNTIGRRSGMCDGSGATAWIYDALGRPTIEERTLNAVTKNLGYVYWKDGHLGQLWYPSGDRINLNVTAAGRTDGATDSSDNYVADNAKFTPNGMLSGMSQYARSGSNTIGLSWNFFYSNRFQRTLEYAGYSTTLLTAHCYDFHLKTAVSVTANGLTCSYPASSGDNGNVYQITNKLDDTRTQNFVYDPLNRINQAYTNGSNWGEQFTVDAWGNLAAVSSLSGKAPVGVFTASATNKNQLSCTTGCTTSYDAAGNTLTTGNGSITYDAENRVLTAAGMTYTYDGDGKRVKKSNGTLYWTGTSSDALSESDRSGNINEEYVFFNGMRVSKVDRPSLNVHAFLDDDLGSSRMIVTPSSATVMKIEEDLDYTPYGILAIGNSVDHYEFTGKERDSESSLDNFGFRYYSSSLGRFMKPDNGSGQDSADPQSWNLYSYVLNGPTTQTDDDGHSVTICSSFENRNQHCHTVDDDAYKAAQQADKNNIAPSLSSLQNSETGFGVITNARGSPVGTVQWTTDNPGIQTLGLAGSMGMNGLKAGVTQMAFDALGIGFGRLIGGGIEAARAAQLAKAGEEAGVGAEEILAKAASSVGNQGIKASSRAAAEEAAEKWVGEGARPIFREGQQIGWESADGTKVVRFTSAGKPDPYINLTNKTTGGNLHVHF